MRSLRARLFVVLLATFLTAWAAAFISFGTQLTRDRTGAWDTALSDFGREILLSVPDDVRALSGATSTRSIASPERSLNRLAGLGFQVWIKPSHELMVRSSSAAQEALKPDFVDGFAFRTIAGTEWRVYAVSDSQGQVQVQVGKPTAELMTFFRKRMLTAFEAMSVLLLVVAFAVWLVVYRSFRPIVQVQEALAARDALNLNPLPNSHLPDEIYPLIEAFNRLLARVDKAVQNERRFITEAAHEMRTPLASLLTHAQVALRCKTLDECKGPLLELVRGVERTARLSQQLLDSARQDVERQSGEKMPLELADIIVMITREFETMATARQQTIVLNVEPSMVYGNVDDLGVLASNLIDNAVRYSGLGARVTVRCERDMQFVRLHVYDNGPGIPEDDRIHIFDRFFRVRGTNERGSGIGLSLVARIAASHGASILTGNGPEGHGFAITVSFPALDESGQATRPPAIS